MREETQANLRAREYGPWVEELLELILAAVESSKGDRVDAGYGFDAVRCNDPECDSGDKTDHAHIERRRTNPSTGGAGS